MRIIGGQRRGKILISPPDDSIRPTSDRARESLFNILLHRYFPEGLTETHWLDLFCGTGAVACEALSRGVAAATLIDENEGALQIARKNVDVCGFSAAATFRRVDALAFITHGDLAPFGIIFADPPYQTNKAQQTLDAVAASRFTGLFILETDAKLALTTPEGTECLLLRRYGKGQLSFWQKARNA